MIITACCDRMHICDEGVLKKHEGYDEDILGNNGGSLSSGINKFIMGD